MKSRRLLTTLAALGLTLAGCVSSLDSHFAFPPNFTAQQLIRVELDGRAETFVALLRRSARTLDVTLMDPLFLMPMVSVTKNADGTRSRWFVPEPAQSKAAGAGMPERLMGLLGDLYGEARWDDTPAAGGKTANFLGFRAALSGIPQTGTCRFPTLIVVVPRVGPAREVRVETSDVRCGTVKDAR